MKADDGRPSSNQVFLGCTNGDDDYIDIHLNSTGNGSELEAYYENDGAVYRFCSTL